MTCAATTTVIPAQAGTQTRIDERDACVEVLRSTAKRERFTTRTPTVTCLGPGLRRDDVLVRGNRANSSTAVIPAQAGIQTHVHIGDARGVEVSPAAHAFSLADRAPVAICVGPGLRRDDDHWMVALDINPEEEVCISSPAEVMR